MLFKLYTAVFFICAVVLGVRVDVLQHDIDALTRENKRLAGLECKPITITKGVTPAACVSWLFESNMQQAKKRMCGKITCG